MTKKPWGVFVRTYPSVLTDITSLASTANSTPTWVMWFKQWNGSNFAWTLSEWTTLLSAGYTPLLTWQPRYNDRTTNHILSANILAGTYDSLIASYAQGIAALNGNVLIRLMHEMNGNWDDWMIGQGDYSSGAVYISTYQYIVNKFRSSVAGGVPNAKFVWCPNVEFSGQTATFSQVYPGDAYVDIIGLDGYNTNDNQNWQTYSQIFAQSVTDIVAVAPSKPLYIMETGCIESAYPYLNSKAVWLEDAIARINQDSRIAGFNYWHATGSGGSPDYGIGTSTTSQLAFASALQQANGFSSFTVHA